uniref:CARD domain-containing protein n=1 Tax=Plectus sambesii TaxID=2011161 RepID=A0A914VIH6_9BILA
MNEEHKNALERSLHDISQDLDAEDVLPYLRSKGVVKEEQAQEIMKITRKPTQNMQLIDFIKAAGPVAFQEFINALQTCNKERLAEKILAHLSSFSDQRLALTEMNTTNTFNSHNHDGRNVSGVVQGGIIVQGDYHACSHETLRSPIISPSRSSQPNIKERQQVLGT